MMVHAPRSIATARYGRRRPAGAFRWLAAATVAAVAATLVPFAASARSNHAATAAATKTVKVKIHDTSFTLSAKTAPAGTVVFAVTNLGTAIHNFSVNGKKTAALKHGKTARLTVAFKKAGAFTYRSTIKGNSKKLTGVFKVTAAPAPAVPGNVTAGKTVFQTNCTACHTLKEAGAVGTIGPNLDTLKLSDATIVTTVTHGKTGSLGTMPPFGSTLTAKQITDVAAFVYSAEH